MKRHNQVIWVQPHAPPKPAEGEPCNGCGVCCLSEPCPLGVLLSFRLHGACAALRWLPQEQIYRCGALSSPSASRGVRGALSRLRYVWLRRAIGAEQGCDCSLEPSPAP